jgi:hypothetical protein
MKRALIPVGIALAALFSAVRLVADGPPDGFYRFPSIGGGTIVFASEGDIWRVPVA